jgi:ATP-binding cassette subfamily C protein CydC
LQIKALSFRRDRALQPILDKVSLAISAGECVAITGPSGSGKSTLLLLAARLLAPEAGQITIGSLPLEDWDEARLRAVVTLVPQRSALMAGTVGDALRLGCPDASEAALWEVLEAVSLTSVIRSKGGMEARLGPQGTGLSGGEARRLVLARSLLRQPRLLLMDEPTEGLDEKTALAVLAGIRSYLPTAAILTASHHPAEIGWANRVIQLD